jgi:arsenite transporter
MGGFQRNLTVWIRRCTVAGILLGKYAPDFGRQLDGLAVDVNDALVVSVPIAICAFFVMYPIRVKVDFTEVIRADRNVKPVTLTLVVNWGIKPFTRCGIAYLFLGLLLRDWIGAGSLD